ncbi:hypothetical protein OAI97_03010 [Nitrosopumilus sp.]|nr:hypothetical protein [Nitrosopumilus sp.]
MNNGSFEDTINDIENESKDVILKQQVYFDHLANHKISSDPEKAEFLMLFGSLLESKIKNKIKMELNRDCLTYFLEFPTLITRSSPHKKFKDDDPFLKNDSEQNDPYAVVLESISAKISGSSLGEFISNCFTYNSPSSIFKMLSDFALVEYYYNLNHEEQFDLQNRGVKKFLVQRNNSSHNLLDTKISDTYFIKENLDKILEHIVLMISTALQVRRTSIDHIQSSKNSEDIEKQLDWLKRILFDHKKNHMDGEAQWKYSEWFSTDPAHNSRVALEKTVECLKKKLEEEANA